MKRILIVDDEPSLIKGLRFNLQQQDGYTVDEALDGQQALDMFVPAGTRFEAPLPLPLLEPSLGSV